MRPSKTPPVWGPVTLLILAVSILSANLFATTEKVAYSFLAPPDGSSPQGGLVADAAGNLYGTTVGGGTAVTCCGTVFELSPPTTTGGAWSETILHTFLGLPNDGGFPRGTLIIDKLGNLYGTTQGGGAKGYGSVFELSPPATPGGAWTETVLWAFPSTSSGIRPSGKLVMDAGGNLYGTASQGGKNTVCNCGTVFELVAPKTAGGPRSMRVLYNFGTVANDGIDPAGDLLLRGGVLYGTAVLGGSANSGIVFQLVRKPGFWTQTVLYTFTGGSDGLNPNGGLIADSSGDFYGTTISGGGSCNCGTVYELSPPTIAGNPWTEATLHAFANPGDGKNPFGALWRDKFGNLYGTTNGGGKNASVLGTVFKLRPPAVSGGAWTLSVLHYFGGLSVGDGANPYSALISVNGLLYGTTYNGGKKFTDTRTGGTVFNVLP